MVIISKFKDYYDYLSGIYGEDPKLVLDRRVHEQPYFYGSQVITLFICGKIIQGFYDGKTFHYGESLKELGEVRSYRGLWNPSPNRTVFIKNKDRYSVTHEHRVDIDILDDDKKLNIKENCPIIMSSLIYSSKILRYPILSKMNVSSVFPPEQIYQMLVQWLSDRISDSEVVVDNRNDVDKLLSKGFDKRESFRPKIKTNM